jgi:hypothetical protein
MGHEIQFNSKFGAKLSLLCPFFLEHFQLTIVVTMFTITINVLEPSAFNLEFHYLVEVGLRAQNAI